LAKNLGFTYKRAVHGRKHGRPLKRLRSDMLDALLPRLEVFQPFLKEDGTLEPEKLFDVKPEVLHLEIGFGNGEHLVDILDANPGHHIIGAEPYTNGVSAFLTMVREDPPVDRCRILMGDALRVVHSLTEASVDFLYILNPDPWPKARHHKRRMVVQPHLDAFARVLKDGGTMIQTTDVAELAGWMASQTVRHPAFEWQANCQKDWETSPEGWLPTRYEMKGREAGRVQSYLVYKRLPRKA
jgi:tRNA (guanine-N7-)-methyltransferase